MAGMDRHPQIGIIEDGDWPDHIHPEFMIDHTRRRDKVTGCTYRVKVVGPTKLEYEWDPAGAMRLREAVKGRPGLHVHFSSALVEYCGKMSTVYDLKFRGRISKRSHEEALTPLINLGGIPLAARDEIIVLIFSQYDEDVAPIQALAQVYVYGYVSPNHENLDEDIYLPLEEAAAGSSEKV